nr:reverse transcriptase domain-containing protein [Tanacetum cinerariifolium]
MCMAHDSINQVVREEATVRKNVSNKRKWGSDHGRDSDQQQSKKIEMVRAYATGGKGHTKRYCPEIGNQNRDREARQNLNIVMENMSTSGQGLSAANIKKFITQCAAKVMAAYEKNQNNQNRDGKPHVNARGVVPVARKCTYQDFVKCQPFNFKGTEGVVGLTRWFEKMKTVFHISNCPQKCQVKYASCTLQDSALTW